jgi:hypothetical protein
MAWEGLGKINNPILVSKQKGLCLEGRKQEFSRNLRENDFDNQ